MKASIGALLGADGELPSLVEPLVEEELAVHDGAVRRAELLVPPEVLNGDICTGGPDASLCGVDMDYLVHDRWRWAGGGAQRRLNRWIHRLRLVRLMLGFDL